LGLILEKAMNQSTKDLLVVALGAFAIALPMLIAVI
jgi:hypothetical protein